MKNIHLLLMASLLILVSCTRSAGPESTIDPALTLWYDSPAAEWTEALPVSNGRIGAMVFGRTENETIQFNEETLWSGQPHDYASEGAYRYLTRFIVHSFFCILFVFGSAILCSIFSNLRIISLLESNNSRILVKILTI